LPTINHVIYRKADRLIAGIVFDRNSENDTTKALAVEIQNVVNSELRGEESDYGHAPFSGAIPEGKVIEISQNNTVEFADDRIHIAREAARLSGLTKLKKLGLTTDEITAIIGG
jgi:hypothetical protein